MNTLYSCLIFIILLTSCATDTDSFPAKAVSGNLPASTTVMQRGDILPANSANAFDAAGRLHNELFEAYYAGNTMTTSIDSLVTLAESIGTANIEFDGLKGLSYVPVSGSQVSYIITNISTSQADIIDAAPLTAAAKISLTGFVDDLIPLYDTAVSYDIIYSFIVQYEAAIMQSSQLTQGDKELLLTTSSIARYSTYMGRKKPKANTDADWTVFIGNVVGSVEGASEGTAEAIMKAFVTGVAENNFD